MRDVRAVGGLPGAVADASTFSGRATSPHANHRSPVLGFTAMPRSVLAPYSASATPYTAVL